MGRVRIGIAAIAMAAVLIAAGCGGDNSGSKASAPAATTASTSAATTGAASSAATTSAASTSATTAAGAATTAAGSAATTVGASGSTVSLPGKVNDHGSATVKDGDTIEMEADDIYFSPTFVTGPAGAEIKVSLANEGAKEHTFTIDAAKIDQDLKPDAKATVDVTLPASGTLAFYCRFHKDGGMQGAFSVA